MSARARVSLAMAVLWAIGLVPSTAPAAVAPSFISPNLQVNARDLSQSVQDFKSPALAINPSNPNQAVSALRFDHPDYYCQVYFSRDGGSSWAKSALPPPPLGTCWVPAAAFANDGTVYVTAQDRPAQDDPVLGGRLPQNTIVWKSTDGGANFAAPVVVPGSIVAGRNGPGTGAVFSPGIAVDNGSSPTSHPGRVYVTWEAPSQGTPPVRGTEDAPLSYSDDHGATWSTPAHGTLDEREQIPYPAVGPDGTVYIEFKSSRNTIPFQRPPLPPDECQGVGFGDPGPTYQKVCPIEVMRSSDGGNTIDAPVTIANSYFLDLAVAEQPGIAVTPPSAGAPSGTVLVTFATRLPASGVPAGCQNTLHSVVYRSVDRGQTWSGPVRISDEDPCASTSTQRDPYLSVAPNGRIDAVVYDNRNDPGRNHGFYDTYYANSTDGGQTFGPNARLTPTSFDATAMFTPLAAGFQTNEYDQVNAIASTNDGAVAAWTDSRNATGSAPTTITDVFSSRIGLAAPISPIIITPPGTKPGVPRVNLRGLRLSARRVVRGRRTLFVVRGALRLPPGIARSGACSGLVTVAVRRGRRTGGRRTVRLRTNCTFSLTIVAPTRKLGRQGRYNLRARFHGNPSLNPRTQTTNIR